MRDVEKTLVCMNMSNIFGFYGKGTGAREVGYTMGCLLRQEDDGEEDRRERNDEGSLHYLPHTSLKPTSFRIITELVIYAEMVYPLPSPYPGFWPWSRASGPGSLGSDFGSGR